MKLTNVFVLAGLALLAFLSYLLFYIFDGDFKFASAISIISVIAVMIISILILSLLISLLVSLFSIRKKKFKAQLSFISPLIFITIVLLFTILAFFYKKGDEIGDVKTKWLVKYSNVKSPPGIDYASIKNGKFLTGELEIERNDSVQIQKDITNDSTYYYNISWLQPSEYILTDLGNPQLKLFVKVTAVDDSSYTCYFCTDTISTPPTLFIKVRKYN